MTNNFDHIEHAKMIYQFQPNAFTAAAYQIVLQLDRIKTKTEADAAAAEAAKKESKRRLAEIKEQQAKMRWQPIETAPRDGSCFLGYIDYEKQEGDDYEFYSVIRWETGIGWVEETLEMHSFEATHWMPLPEPPK